MTHNKNNTIDENKKDLPALLITVLLLAGITMSITAFSGLIYTTNKVFACVNPPGENSPACAPGAPFVSYK